MNETNMQLKERLERERKEEQQAKRSAQAAARKPAEKTATRPTGTGTGAGGSVPGEVDTVMETVQTGDAEPKIIIPLPLKKQLVDDWERITQVRTYARVYTTKADGFGEGSVALLCAW
jgi:hypothetical protein